MHYMKQVYIQMKKWKSNGLYKTRDIKILAINC